MFKVGDIVRRKKDCFDHYWNEVFNGSKKSFKVLGMIGGKHPTIENYNRVRIGVDYEFMELIVDVKFEEHRERLLNA